MQNQVNIQRNTRTGVIDITISGNLCGKEAVAFKTILSDILKQGNRFVVIRTEEVKNIDLTAVNVCVTMLKQFRDVKGELYLNYAPKTQIADWLHLTKFHTLFNAIPSNLI